jgi:dTDP-4-amino-4,6-dideoxygalactose transaminase
MNYPTPPFPRGALPERSPDPVTEFEKRIAEFFGAPYAVAVDSCTHGLELCLRYVEARAIFCPKRTYVSVPMLAIKLNLALLWREEDWKDYYCIRSEYPRIYDAAVLWKVGSYLPGGVLMCLSFQYQKHLSLGRGGMILCPDKTSYDQLKKMSYDGRLPNIPWREQDIDTMGYHYYMTPETAQLGLDKLDKAIATEPRQWVVTDWPDVSQFKVFNK